MSDKLHFAVNVVLDRYHANNPLRTADVHERNCGCLRCCMDFLEATRASETEEENARIRGFQNDVSQWMLACFGETISADQLERADRFTEEALELAQTMPGFTADRAHALVDYVFGRPVGEHHQEVGGVMVTLAALCNTVDLDINIEARRELARIWTKVEQIRAKQAAKPTGSALPVAALKGSSHG